MKQFLMRFINMEEIRETWQRFPYSICFAFLAFCFALNEINKIFDIPEQMAARTMLFFGLGFLWAGVIKIIAESRNLPAIKYNIALGSGVFVYALFAYLPTKDDLNIWLMLIHLAVANCILLSFAPFMKKAAANDSLWEYNRRLWFGASLAFVAALIFWAGFSGGFTSVGYLFDIKIGHKFYMSLWAFAALVLAPVYALSHVPRRFDFEREECQLQKSLTFIVKWILLPLVLIYFVILYAYFAKMVILWEIPKGQLAYMITSFSAAGILTYLVAWPYPTEGQKLFSFFKRYFFALLILPSLVLVLAVWLRIDQYGVTLQRFYLGMGAGYIVFVSLFMTFIRNDLRILFTVPILLLLLSSTPLFNGRIVSQHSQQARLDAMLIKNNMLVSGVLQKPVDPSSVSQQDRYRIYDMMLYLARSYSDQERSKKLYGFKSQHISADELRDRVGFSIEQDRAYNHNNCTDEGMCRFSYRVEIRPDDLRWFIVTGYDYYLDDFVTFKNDIKSPRKLCRSGEEEDLCIFSSIQVNILIIHIGDEQLEINLRPVVSSLLKDYPRPDVIKEYPELFVENDHYAIKYRVHLINGERSGDGKEIDIFQVGGAMLIKRK